MKRSWLWLLPVIGIGFLGMPAVSVLAGLKQEMVVGVEAAKVAPVFVQSLRQEAVPWAAGPDRWTANPTGVIFTRVGDTYRAFRNRSTHLGCRVERWENTEQLYDICFGSVWNLEGKAIGGPAPRGLDWYPVTMRHGWLEVNLSVVQLGESR